MPKGQGTTRPWGISAVKDRGVQAAVQRVLEPSVDREFLAGNDGLPWARG